MRYLQRDNDIRYGMHRVKTSSFTMYFTMCRTMGTWLYGRHTSASVETFLTLNFQSTESLRTLACKQQDEKRVPGQNQGNQLHTFVVGIGHARIGELCRGTSSRASSTWPFMGYAIPIGCRESREGIKRADDHDLDCRQGQRNAANVQARSQRPTRRVFRMESCEF